MEAGRESIKQTKAQEESDANADGIKREQICVHVNNLKNMDECFRGRATQSSDAKQASLTVNKDEEY